MFSNTLNYTAPSLLFIISYTPAWRVILSYSMTRAARSDLLLSGNTLAERQQRWAGLKHIWMKNIWSSLSLHTWACLRWSRGRRPTDSPSACVFFRLTLPADDGSVVDVLGRDPRPPDCLWVLPALCLSLSFSFLFLRAVCGVLEGRTEGMEWGKTFCFGEIWGWKCWA